MNKWETAAKELSYELEDGLTTSCADAIDSSRIDVVHAKVSKGLLARMSNADTSKAMLEVQVYLRKHAVAPTDMNPLLRRGYTNGLNLA